MSSTLSTLETLSNDLAAAVERAGRSVVAIHARRRIPASGVLWRPGLVVATDHTVHKDDDVRVTLADGLEARATVVGRDPTTDLCVLRFDSESRLGVATPSQDSESPATLTRAPLRVGQLVLALGRPGPAVTASMGVVSAVGPEWRTWRGGRVDQFVRLDVAIYDGFSGGAIADAAGHVLGVGTSGLARAAAVVVPATTVDRVVDQLLAGGRMRPAYLGIGTQPVKLGDAMRQRLPHAADAGAPEWGLMLVAVEPDSPADRAGLLLGDVLVALGGTPTGDPRDVLAALGPDAVGRPIAATLLRAGAPITVEVTAGEHPGPELTMSILSTAELQGELAAIAAALRASTVVVRSAHGRSTPGGQGSGIVWSAGGTIVTNAHVATEPLASIELPDGRVVAARLTLRDPSRDLALLQLDPIDGLSPATRGDPASLRPGTLVLAHGHPLGVPHALALGIVHTIGRASWQRRGRGGAALIHSDVRLAPGNSGGPLADARGRVVGVNAMIAGGLGVAVSIDEVDALLLRATPRPRLGATLRRVAVRHRRSAAIATGLLVLALDAGGAADRAGLLIGDVLLGHAGRPFDSADDLVSLLRSAGPGASVHLDVGRAGRQLAVSITLGDAIDLARQAA